MRSSSSNRSQTPLPSSRSGWEKPSMVRVQKYVVLNSWCIVLLTSPRYRAVIVRCPSELAFRMFTDVGTVDPQVSATYMVIRVITVPALETALHRKVAEAGIGDHLGARGPTVGKVVTY